MDPDHSADGDNILILQFRAARSAIIDGDPARAERMIYELESAIVDRFALLRRRSQQLADANAEAIEMVARHDELADRLKKQNEELAAHADRLRKTWEELEAQSQALANANVDAVLRAEALESALDKKSALADTLTQDREALKRDAQRLSEEARALADANSAAVELMEEQESALAQAKVRANELETINRDLESRAFRDHLTGLYNHGYFKEQLRLEFPRAKRYERPLSVIFVDVDHFKKLNDTHGHAAGDVVLRRVGDLIASATRSADIIVRTNTAPVAARYGGEEFVVVLPETPGEGAKVVAERLRQLVESTQSPYASTQPLGHLSISVGVATLDAADADPSALIARADAALYRAKRSGRNAVCVATGDDASMDGSEEPSGVPAPELSSSPAEMA